MREYRTYKIEFKRQVVAEFLRGSSSLRALRKPAVMLRSYFLLTLMTMPAAAQNVPPLTGMPCLQIGNIEDYHPLPGRRSLVVIDKQHKQYRLDFVVVCESLQPHANLGFHTFNPSQYSCLARGDSVYSSNDVGANRLCRIKDIDYFNEAPLNPVPTIITGGRARG